MLDDIWMRAPFRNYPTFSVEPRSNQLHNNHRRSSFPHSSSSRNCNSHQNAYGGHGQDDDDHGDVSSDRRTEDERKPTSLTAATPMVLLPWQTAATAKTSPLEPLAMKMTAAVTMTGLHLRTTVRGRT